MTATHVLIPTEEWHRVLSNQESQQKQIDSLMSFVGAGNSETLTRQQAMEFLHIGSTKLWELARDGEIKTTTVGTKTLYVTASCRAYLEGRGYSKEQVTAQLESMLREKQRAKIKK